jgi:putative transcriptional regulator
MSKKSLILANRFSELLAIKSRQEGRRISRREVCEATGLSRSAIDSYARNAVTRFDAPIVLALCTYFECEPGELLIIEEVDEPSEMQTLVFAT